MNHLFLALSYARQIVADFPYLEKKFRKHQELYDALGLPIGSPICGETVCNTLKSNVLPWTEITYELRNHDGSLYCEAMDVLVDLPDWVINLSCHRQDDGWHLRTMFGVSDISIRDAVCQRIFGSYGQPLEDESDDVRVLPLRSYEIEGTNGYKTKVKIPSYKRMGFRYDARLSGRYRRNVWRFWPGEVGRG